MNGSSPGKEGPSLERSQALFLEVFQGFCRGDKWARRNAAGLEPDQKTQPKIRRSGAILRPVQERFYDLPRQRMLLADLSGLGHLEGKAEARQILAGMIIRIAELRDAKVQRPRFLALVDGGIEVDEVPARLAARLEEDLHVALAVKGAGVADIVVVVDDRVDVRGLRPAHALQMDLERRACRPARDVERKRIRCDPMRSRFPACAERDP